MDTLIHKNQERKSSLPGNKPCILNNQKEKKGPGFGSLYFIAKISLATSWVERQKDGAQQSTDGKGEWVTVSEEDLGSGIQTQVKTNWRDLQSGSITKALNWNKRRNKGGGFLCFKSRLPRDTNPMAPGLLKHPANCPRGSSQCSFQHSLACEHNRRLQTFFCSSPGVTVWHPACMCQISAFVNKGFVIP